MADFSEALSISLTNYDENLSLKPKQLDALKKIYEGKDTLVLLPTGYGKSVIFHLLPKLFGDKIVICVSPLNAIIMDQIKRLRSRGILACALTVSGTVTQCTVDSDTDSDDQLDQDLEVFTEQYMFY